MSQSLTLIAPNTTKAAFANTVYPDERAHDEPSYPVKHIPNTLRYTLLLVKHIPNTLTYTLLLVKHIPNTFSNTLLLFKHILNTVPRKAYSEYINIYTVTC